MMTCGRLFAVALLSLALFAGTSSAVEYASFSEWAANELGAVPPDPTPATNVFGTQTGTWNSGVGSIVGLAYDQTDNGVWIANEDAATGNLYLQSVAAGHANIRTFNVQAYGLTSDGNSDGAAVDGARVLLTDFNGDLVLHDDIIMSINRVSGVLNEFWNVDGPLNPNPNANINTILGICVDGGGRIWATNNLATLKQITLGAGGAWTQVSTQAVPGGGSWAEIDFDPCLNQFFATNFQLNRHQHHALLTAAPLATFPGVGGSNTAITSNNAGTVFTSGFGSNPSIINQHEGIACQTTAVEPTTWGSLKANYR